MITKKNFPRINCGHVNLSIRHIQIRLHTDMNRFILLRPYIKFFHWCVVCGYWTVFILINWLFIAILVYLKMWLANSGAKQLHNYLQTYWKWNPMWKPIFFYQNQKLIFQSWLRKNFLSRPRMCCKLIA